MAYVYGNTAPKEIDIPKVQEEKKPKELSHQVRKNRKKAHHMNKGFVKFLTVAAVAATVVCVQYLNLQSEVLQRSRNIATLQKELTTLREENTVRYNTVLNSINLEEMRERAINEFGMVPCGPESIIKYKSPTSNQIKQYGEIPGNGIANSTEQ